jgi:hypothetical protein
MQIIQNEEEKIKLDNLTKLSTLNLIQGSETKSGLDELKLTVKEINLKVIEYGIFQDERKNKELQEKEATVKKEEKERDTHQIPRL